MNSSSGVLSLSPGIWLGNDGNWSTFSVTVGNASKPFYVLPATGGSQLWLPDPNRACNLSVVDCSTKRGVPAGVSLDDVAGWAKFGLSEVQATPPLFNASTADLWLGRVQLNSTEAAILDDVDQRMPVAAYNDPEYWLGLMGLGNDPTTFGDKNQTTSPSALEVLKNAGHIGSLSYGYTAGFEHLDEPGSLTLGGYDGARYQPDNVVNATITNTARKLQLHVSDISLSGAIDGTVQPLLPPDQRSDGIAVLLDSSTAQLWLPPDVCDLFAEAFGLKYLSQSNLYVIDGDAYAELHENRANLSFTIGNSNSLDGSTTITLPFKAYDLPIDQPLSDALSRYFPLRNATSGSGNILGRVFLQEAYVVVDWERGTFNVSRTTHGVNETRLVPIAPVSTISPDDSSLTRGQQAGIAIPCLILFFASLALIWWRRRRRNRMRIRKASEAPTMGTVETAGSGWEKPELMASESKKGHLLELDFLRGEEADSTQLLEMSGTGPEQELMSNEIQEMEGDMVHPDVKEQTKGADSNGVQEMEGDLIQPDVKKLVDGADSREIREMEGDLVQPDVNEEAHCSDSKENGSEEPKDDVDKRTGSRGLE